MFPFQYKTEIVLSHGSVKLHKHNTASTRRILRPNKLLLDHIIVTFWGHTGPLHQPVKPDETRMSQGDAFTEGEQTCPYEKKDQRQQKVMVLPLDTFRDRNNMFSLFVLHIEKVFLIQENVNRRPPYSDMQQREQSMTTLADTKKFR